jgi:hypothetical protein
VPPAIREVCLAVAITEVENPTGIRAEAIDGYSVSYLAEHTGSNASLRAQLAPYVRAWAA